MVSLVSAEHAFSQVGITVSKWCNRLGGDIVEAIQHFKSCIWQDLIFQEAAPLSMSEVDSEVDVEDNLVQGEKKADDDSSWDTLIGDDDGDCEYDDDTMALDLEEEDSNYCK